MSDQDELAVKSKDISTALGISNEPPKLNAGHTQAVDALHDAVGETKTDMQAKGNYVASTHLSSAQRHLKDAKAVLDTKALNTDTKHVLAKAALGRASASLTKATSAASAQDKPRVFGHNSDLRAFASNPDGTFAKMNENHDDHGRFASGDGGGSGAGNQESRVTDANAPERAMHQELNTASVDGLHISDNALEVHSNDIHAVAEEMQNNRPSGLAGMDHAWAAQQLGNAASQISDAHSIISGDQDVHARDVGEMKSLVDQAGATIDKVMNQGFDMGQEHYDELQRLSENNGLYSQILGDAIDATQNHGSVAKSLGTLTDVQSAALSIQKNAEIFESFEKMNENHDEKGRFASGDGGGSSSDSSTGSKVPGSTKAVGELQKIEENIKGTYANEHNAQRTAGQPATPNMMDMHQAYNDGLNHLSDAKAAIQRGDWASARDSVHYAADGLNQSPVFTAHSWALTGQPGYWRGWGAKT